MPVHLDIDIRLVPMCAPEAVIMRGRRHLK